MVGFPVLGCFDRALDKKDYPPALSSEAFTQNRKGKRIIETLSAVPMWGFLDGKLSSGWADRKFMSGQSEAARNAREWLLKAMRMKGSKSGVGGMEMILNEES